MNLKRIMPALLMVMSTVFVVPAFASDKTPPAITENSTANERSQQLEARIMEIKNMDKSNLTTKERRALRKELRHMRQERKVTGVYISVGALIIIILLLIILL